jgi:ketosteroid isomerase-like protein
MNTRVILGAKRGYMNEKQPEAVETEFFEALVNSDVDKFHQIVAHDIVLIDVMSGTEVSGAELANLLKSGDLRFISIDRIAFRVRIYGNAAIITGQTFMAGTFAGHEFKLKSAYTHVFVKESLSWRMVSAQGTPVTPVSN